MNQFTIELTDEEIEEFVKYMYYELSLKTLAPDVIPKDLVALRVIGAIKLHYSQKKGVPH